ncbi:MAG: LysM peptidoglycan-binding domain-containing protein [Clostridia bacterium]|nr:LysM peptidoglycan-binding domain-containing protein [Clostridia bacterium]
MNGLQLKTPRYYKVKRGQTVREIAAAFCVAERALVKCNALTGEPCAGELLRIPDTKGNAYTVKEGDNKALLSGGDTAYERKNGTAALYLGMRVIL